LKHEDRVTVSLSALFGGATTAGTKTKTDLKDMAKTEMTLSGETRLQILSLLPQEAGSLQESIQIKRLRDRVGFDEEEKDLLDMDERGSFNPSKVDDLEDKGVSLGENEKEIIAGCIVQKEDEESVPTNDAFVDLALTLQDKVKEFRDQLDDPDA